MDTLSPKNIWLISDGKPGHETQLIGLSERLHALCGASIHWHRADVSSLRRNKKNTTNPEQSPDLLISAGHRTHRTLYFYARRYKAFSTVLMKPSLPLRLFDAVICPKHDGLKASSRVFNTEGAINKITPPNPMQKCDASRQNSILIGGPSKHYDWNQAWLIHQIIELVTARPLNDWRVYDSPRTPEEFGDTLKAQAPPNLTFLPMTEQTGNTLQEALQNSAECWITPDSVSMIYESLTAGCATATFKPFPDTRTKSTRVALGLQRMLDKAQIAQWNDHALNLALPQNHSNLWEADRAARWLLERFAEQM